MNNVLITTQPPLVLELQDYVPREMSDHSRIQQSPNDITYPIHLLCNIKNVCTIRIKFVHH